MPLNSINANSDCVLQLETGNRIFIRGGEPDFGEKAKSPARAAGRPIRFYTLALASRAPRSPALVHEPMSCPMLDMDGTAQALISKNKFPYNRVSTMESAPWLLNAGNSCSAPAENQQDHFPFQFKLPFVKPSAAASVPVSVLSFMIYSIACARALVDIYRPATTIPKGSRRSLGEINHIIVDK